MAVHNQRKASNKTHNQTTTLYSSIKLLIPFSSWPTLSNKYFSHDLRGDTEAAFTGAIIAIPQAIALAALAGLPPQYGIYASILPVIFAMIWGSSWHLVSGPNTAVSLMLAATIAPFALAGDDYLQMILLLTFLVGALQLLVGLLRLGSVLDFVSNTVIVAVTHAVALILIVSALSSVMGLANASGASFLTKLWTILTDAFHSNPSTLTIGILTIGIGLFARKFSKRYALALALIGGSIAAFTGIHFLGVTADEIPLLGAIPLSFSPWSVPPLNLEAYKTSSDLMGNVIAIAFVGLMQSVVIARSLSLKSGQLTDANRECVGQGMANLVAPFVSAFAGSGSFNRSASHLQLGARTPMSLIYSVLFLLIMVIFARPLLEQIPKSVIAALLFLVGLGLLDFKAIKRILLSASESIIFFSVLCISLLFGLSEGVLTGVLISLLVYLGKTSIPRLNFSKFDTRDGRSVSVVGIDGNLFFGSVPSVEQSLPSPPAKDPKHHLLLIQTRHLTYLDIPGAELLLRQVKAWREAGSDAYIKVAPSEFIAVFDNTGLLDELGEGCIIRADRLHIMKDQFNTQNTYDSDHSDPFNHEEYSVKKLAQRIHSTHLLGPIPVKRLTELLESQKVFNAKTGDIIVNIDQALSDHIILLEGELEVQRIWSKSSGYETSHTWVLFAKTSPITGSGINDRNEANDIDTNHPAILTAASKRLRARALSPIKYLRLDADTIDHLLGWYSQDAVFADIEDEVKEHMTLIRQVGVFHHIPLEKIKDVYQHLRPVHFNAGKKVVKEGDKGESYYIIEEGEAEVIRTDPFTDEIKTVAHLGAGDGFGEESLLQDGFRNATVKMITPGTLLELTRTDFETLVKPSMVEEINAEDTHKLIEQNQVKLLDCRYDLEYEESRIPDATLIPLHELRNLVHQLEPDARYIVYCRSGRRSKAAAFLLKERNLNVASLMGGIRDWPYEIESNV